MTTQKPMNNFGCFILTHGRPHRVKTYDLLRRCGYTGKIHIVIDDEDPTADEYRDVFGDQVLMFSKSEIAATFDEAGNFTDRRAIVYARNACFQLAKDLGLKYFIQLDDDYRRFDYRFTSSFEYCEKLVFNLDRILEIMVEFLEATPFLTVAFMQNGDFFGGKDGKHAKVITGLRKAMNSFICSTDKPFQFQVRINEDVNLYTSAARRGLPFLSINQISLSQTSTQAGEGGMTDIYLDSGTYVKSFYSVIFAPSCVKITPMGYTAKRLHHQVSWNNAAVKIINEQHRKPRP